MISHIEDIDIVFKLLLTTKTFLQVKDNIKILILEEACSMNNCALTFIIFNSRTARKQQGENVKKETRTLEKM